MHCVWCHEPILVEVNWGNVFMPSRRPHLCSSCHDKMHPIDGKRCIRCSRYSNQSICGDCKWWQTILQAEDPLAWNYSVFHYNDPMKEMISRWKYRGDYLLGEAFRWPFLDAFKQTFVKWDTEPLLVPIPLSEERHRERGFNQAEMLATFLDRKFVSLLHRIDGEKQSKKSRQDRIFAENPFRMKKTINKPVILVDDIYTTGATLRHAANVLKQKGSPKVYAFTLIRG